MAITQVKTETVDGVVIGLSDTIYNLIQAGEFTIENLTPYMIVGQKTIGNQYYASLDVSERNYQGSGGSTPAWFPVNNTGSVGPDTVAFQTKASVTLPNMSYGRNILLHGSLETGVEPQQIRADNMLNRDLRVVTSINFKKIYYDVEMASAEYAYNSPPGTATYYQTGAMGCIRTTDNGENTSCYVYSIYGTDDDWYCIKDWMFPADDSTNHTWHMSCSQNISGNFGNTHSSLGTGFTNFATTKTMFRWIGNQIADVYGDNWNWNNTGKLVIVNGDILQVCDYAGAGVYAGGCFNIITGLDNALKQLANAGLQFKWNNTWYKPISDGGVITGYTDDMTTETEWDDITNVTGNTVPVTPSPTPPTPSGDIETDMPLAYIGGTAGMVDFIKINEAGLASADDIADAISRFDITTIGKDLLRNFVAFKCYAVLDIDDSVVRDIKVAGHTLKDENDHALQGEYIGSVSPVDFSAGTISHLYNDFRDYAPYTKIQMYVPFCGWFDLPSWCMGKEITGTMFTDLYNGTVKAVIYASRTVVAEVGGCCAFDIPFAAESTGMKAGAVISSALNTVAMTGATIAAPNIATGIAAVSSAANFISAANSNGTTLKGVMGDGSNTNGLLHVYIKITRPNSPNGRKDIPNTYKHEYGIPCYKQLTLTAGDGFTQILDANITGAMTDREKQMIIDGFRHGLIL